MCVESRTGQEVEIYLLAWGSNIHMMVPVAAHTGQEPG